MNYIKNILFYMGIEKKNYEDARKDINNSNRMMIVVFSGIAAVFITAMYFVSLFIPSTEKNMNVYIAGAVASVGLFLLSFFFAKKHSWIIVPLVYISFSIFFLYGIFIGAVTNPTSQTVTYMVMLVFMPILFIDRPIRVACAILLYDILFLVLCFKNKTGAVLSTDVLDVVVYSILGIISGTIINHIKVRRFTLELILSEAWRTDQLTNMNNRNSFESDLAKYAERCKENISCVYCDVNGLHELNNTKGHHEGDVMLQYVADQVKKLFGTEYSYRIGGDEFVAFVPDSSIEKIEATLKELNELVEKEAYHVALGFEYSIKENLNMDNLIRDAETKMYGNKVKFYQNSNRDRRRRK